MSTQELFKDTLSVVNVGLKGFADDIIAAGGRCLALDWQPPAQGDREGGWALATLLGHPAVEAANEVALARLLAADPVLTGIATARDVLPGMADGRRLIVHAGPPIAWAAMCGPMRGGVLGAVVLEGWADTIEGATRIVERGEVELEPCHHHGAVGPMAGIISPSMPVFVVENEAAKNRSYCNFNEGLGKVLRFGANGPSVIDRLRTMASVVAPTLRAVLERTGPIELKPLMGQALNMGDEVHNRNVAATALFIKRLAPALVETDVPRADMAATLAFVAGNDHFFLNLSMAACKAMCDAAANVPGSSLVTAMARNGVNFGVRLSGTGDAWFEAPANPVDGLYFPGYSIADAAADLGDSAITETAGVGGFAMAAAPAIVKFVGGTPTDAMHHSLRMRAITLGAHPSFTLPALDFASAAAGIDARKVVDCSVLPIINSGIAHREAGIGQIGAGVTTAPMACFTAAVKALARDVAAMGRTR
ncbi:MAG TPA: DUF1116 domain-containing protein [Caldimonas sp.]|nr:DUF1116 domain-containing protein [Caldimonas sp.]